VPVRVDKYRFRRYRTTPDLLEVGKSWATWRARWGNHWLPRGATASLPPGATQGPGVRVWRGDRGKRDPGAPWGALRSPWQPRPRQTRQSMRGWCPHTQAREHPGGGAKGLCTLSTSTPLRPNDEDSAVAVLTHRAVAVDAKPLLLPSTEGSIPSPPLVLMLRRHGPPPGPGPRSLGRPGTPDPSRGPTPDGDTPPTRGRPRSRVRGTPSRGAWRESKRAWPCGVGMGAPHASHRAAPNRLHLDMGDERVLTHEHPSPAPRIPG
jgi:hypothetical protein